MIESQAVAGEEELALFKKQAEETEGNLRQTVDQMNEVSFLEQSSLLYILSFVFAPVGLMIFSVLD